MKFYLTGYDEKCQKLEQASQANFLMGRRSKSVLATIIYILLGTVNSFGDDEVSELFDLWDYDDPAATEVLFISLLAPAQQSDNSEYLPILMTQLARTHSLRDDFTLAHELLDQAKSLITEQELRPWVYLLLERGRAYNSSGKKEKARGYFKEAFITAELLGDDYLAVDAAHMVAIAQTLENQMKWNIIALGIAESSKSAQARNWLGSLYNNMAWTLFDQGDYEKALDLFEKAVEFRREKKNTDRLKIARWAVARTYRALHRLNEAFEIQQSLLAETEGRGLPSDGTVVEELAELYLMKKDPLASDYFARAYRILSQDAWLVKNEPERLARLKKLAVRN